MSRIAIVSPGFPDRAGGVTDHTRRLVHHWGGRGYDVVIEGAHTHIEPSRWAADFEREGVTSLLMQYVPFLYGRKGVSRLPENLARAAVDRGLRVSVFVHEPWVPPSRFPWLVLSPIQRRQLLRLVAVCHATVTAVPAWCELLGDAVHLVYVGSTLGDPGDVDAVPPLLAPVVFSPFAAGLNWDWIRAAINAIGTKPGTIVVGADAKAARIHPQIKRWFDPSWDWLGRLPAEEVLSLLGRAPLVLAPFIDGLTARRTSAMAAMSVGTRVISSSGHLLDPIFENSPAAIAPDERRFVEDAVRNWEATDTPRGHEVRRRWYEARLSATKLDLELLRIVTGDAAS